MKIKNYSLCDEKGGVKKSAKKETLVRVRNSSSVRREIGGPQSRILHRKKTSTIYYNEKLKLIFLKMKCGFYSTCVCDNSDDDHQAEKLEFEININCLLPNHVP